MTYELSDPGTRDLSQKLPGCNRSPSGSGWCVARHQEIQRRRWRRSSNRIDRKSRPRNQPYSDLNMPKADVLNLIQMLRPQTEVRQTAEKFSSKVTSVPKTTTPLNLLHLQIPQTTQDCFSLQQRPRQLIQKFPLLTLPKRPSTLKIGTAQGVGSTIIFDRSGC